MMSLADDDAIGLVTYEDDAMTNRELLSNCSPGKRQEAIDALGTFQIFGCFNASLGDGLFEAQASFAANFDLPSPYWDEPFSSGGVAPCKPDTHLLVVLGAGRNNEPYDYYSGEVRGA